MSPRASFKLRLALVCFNGLAFLVFSIGGTWYRYVTNTRSPYDEVGIDLNSYAPAPLQRWGCAQLAQHFPQALPPAPCPGKGG